MVFHLQIDADPDPAYKFDPDPAYHVKVDMDLDPCGSRSTILTTDRHRSVRKIQNTY